MVGQATECDGVAWVAAVDTLQERDLWQEEGNVNSFGQDSDVLPAHEYVGVVWVADVRSV